ncbi:MAG: hypothetical protein F6K31_40695 [Symploca sp. SIO2G7]|nr:hypothetical protein [Symploca sp. SIO2G7]
MKKKKGNFFLELPEDEMSATPESSDEATAAAETESAAASDSEADTAAVVPAVSAAVSKAAEAMPQETAVPEPTADSVELIRTAIAAASANEQEELAEEALQPTFDYTTPATRAPRRRPGPSMASFKDMAKDVQKTLSGGI